LVFVKRGRSGFTTARDLKLAFSQVEPRNISNGRRRLEFFGSARILRLDPAGGKRDRLGHGPEIELRFHLRAMGFDGLGA
jgi:hypothetical protein